MLKIDDSSYYPLPATEVPLKDELSLMEPILPEYPGLNDEAREHKPNEHRPRDRRFAKAEHIRGIARKYGKGVKNSLGQIVGSKNETGR